MFPSQHNPLLVISRLYECAKLEVPSTAQRTQIQPRWRPQSTVHTGWESGRAEKNAGWARARARRRAESGESRAKPRAKLLILLGSWLGRDARRRVTRTNERAWKDSDKRHPQFVQEGGDRSAAICQ